MKALNSPISTDGAKKSGPSSAAFAEETQEAEKEEDTKISHEEHLSRGLVISPNLYKKDVLLYHDSLLLLAWHVFGPLDGHEEVGHHAVQVHTHGEVVAAHRLGQQRTYSHLVHNRRGIGSERKREALCLVQR
jgi:hypothetical protein